MYIIIIGAGDIGYNLAKILSYERHDIVIVEKNIENFQHSSEGLDAQVILGSGSSYKTLLKAGIRTADMLIAVSNSDEVNMLSAIMAKQYDVKHTIARVSNPEFLDDESPINQEKANIDLLIHPESVAAQTAVHLLKQSAATDFIEFEDGKIILIGIQLDESSPILNQKLSVLAKKFEHIPFRTVAIQRNEKTKIPDGEDFFKANDRIFVIVPKEFVQDLIKETGKKNVDIENIMILGGGQTGYLIAKELEADFNIKIIESKVDKSTILAENLKKSLVIKGDGRDINLLALEGIIDMDAFIAVTGDDETNIVTSLMAKHLEVPKIIALINKTSYAPIIPTIGINAHISKQLLTVNAILKFIRRGSVVSIASIPGIAAEALELIPNPGSKITKKPLKDLKFPKEALLGAVMRDSDVFIPIGSTQIKAGDKVVLFALPSSIHDLEKMFN